MKERTHIPPSITEQVLEFCCHTIIICLFALVTMLTIVKVSGMDIKQNPHIKEEPKTQKSC